MKLKLLLGIIASFFLSSMHGQEKMEHTSKIVGIIKNEKGEKLSGVKITYDDGKVTYTDFAGEFTLKTKSEKFNIELKYLNHDDGNITFYVVDVNDQKLEIVMKETKK